MVMRDRERLIARILTLRRTASEQAEPARIVRGGSPGGEEDVSLETRVAHLERQLAGLQDSVHRGFTRQDRLIAALQAQVDPSAMGAALSEDARLRGL